MRLSRFVTVVIVGAFVLAACGSGGTDAASPAAGDGGSKRADDWFKANRGN